MITETYDSKCGISGLLIVNPIMEYEDNSHKKWPREARPEHLEGAPYRIRTYDLGIRSPLLYPTELMAHVDKL